jgi:sigma-B regulation protein RsbU (phosphoserine phosphatase)
MADAVGHGVPAALMTASLHTGAAVVRAAMEAGTLADDPGRILATLNQMIVATYREKLSATALCLCIEPATRIIRVAAGAHVPPLLVASVQSAETRRRARPIAARGLPLGFASGAEFAVRDVEVAPGDKIVLFTDGIIEAVDGMDRAFGLRRLEQCCGANAGLGGADLIDAILAEVAAYSVGSEPADDMSIVVAELLG